MVVDDHGRAHDVQVAPIAPVAPVAPAVVVDGTVGMNVEISQEFVNPFSDRYEPTADDSVVLPPAPKVKSVVVRGLFPSQPIEEGTSTAIMFPGPHLVLIS
jgi:hypothetical protein